jgi:CubicO group peptidase (beta-lactamase class C family)
MNAQPTIYEIEPFDLDRLVVSICKSSQIDALSLRLVREGISIGSNAKSDYSSSKEETFSVDSRVPIGCLAKSVTATLLAQVCERLTLSLETAVSDVGIVELAGTETDWSTLKLYELLNQGHGCDTLLSAIPYRRDGFIDTRLLLTSTRPISRNTLAPVKLFSDRPVGIWIAAGIVEYLTGRLFRSVVRDLLSDMRILGATGGQFAVSAVELSRLGEMQIEDIAMEALRRYPVAFPGWAPGRVEACCGWYNYGDGWFGSNSHGANHGIALRFNAEKRVAVSITARRQRDAYFLLGALFSESLPEFRSYWFDAGEDARNRREIVERPDLLIGSFRNIRSTIDIRWTKGSGFQMTIRFADQMLGSTSLATLHPLRTPQSNVFRVLTGSGKSSGFLQFASEHNVLWDGRDIWIRVA